ncbi:Protein LURP-one-related 15 [Quillaja saponaria]|uniref:Protein LURP-one-related 15 n=1 Tax=Quillaja saponaria TaxID=32244 RepID=A0AAD7KW61_QUISA|nr:Protein LURP-one-related 15 [Quillaja saponaria]
MAASPISVINSNYCSSDTVNFDIVRKVMKVGSGNFVVTNVNDETIFKVKAFIFTLHDRRILFDSAGNPIVTLYKKIMSMHERWEIYRGESTEPKDLIFTVKRSSVFQWKAKLHVFLANNTAQEKCDFRVENNIIYADESSTIVAHMEKRTGFRSFLFGKDKFKLTVYPNIDFAFIVTLIVILDEICEGDLSKVISPIKLVNMAYGFPGI